MTAPGERRCAWCLRTSHDGVRCRPFDDDGDTARPRAATMSDGGDDVMRCSEPGWRLVAMNDPAGRRGVWIRETATRKGAPLALEVCGGREGDDAYVRLAAGDTLDAAALRALAECLGHNAAWLMHGAAALPSGMDAAAVATTMRDVER